MTNYVRYREDIETIEPGEAETFRKIADLMLSGQHAVRGKYGTSVRISHAKAHAFLTGMLVVERGLAPELAQGMFATPRSYPVLMRLSQAPGEVLDDRKVSSPRGMAIKVFEVEGPKLAGHDDQSTQDFVLENGKAFVVPGPKAFAPMFGPNAKLAPHLPEGVKGAVSHAARFTNSVLRALGTESSKLDVYGHPFRHPLAEPCFSQVPIRYGDYIAKVSVALGAPSRDALAAQDFTPEGADGIRAAAVDYIRKNGAEFVLGIQLNTDLEKMPIEDATVEWSEELSPYQAVARLVFRPQDAFEDRLQDAVDYDLSFSPGHALAAHRPLGGIMRARLAVYPIVSSARRIENARKVLEPRSLEELVGEPPS